MILSRIAYFLNDFATFLILFVAAAVLFSLTVFKIYKSERQNKQKKLLIAISVLIFALVFIFILAEAYFRYVYDVPDGLGFLKVSQKWVERHVIYNNYFYRDRNFESEKKTDITRIGVLGDSIAFGGGIENLQDRFSNILEKKLKDSGYQVEVYNLGRPGYDSQQEIEEFEKVRHLNFDILIWEYFINDIQPNIKSTGTRIIEINRDLPPYITFFTNQSYFLDYLYWRISPKHQKTFEQLRTADILQYENEAILKNHKERIGNFIRSFETTDTKILVVIFPSISLLGPDYAARHVHQLMAETFRSNNVEVLDLQNVFGRFDKQKLMASKFDPHPNEIAHKFAAEEIFPKVIPYLK